MRTYAIVDERARRARPCARLTYDEQHGELSIVLERDATEADVPAILAPFAKEGRRDVPEEWAWRWVAERVPPPSRQNIGGVLKAHGMDHYDEIVLLEEGRGRCSQDDFCLVDLACGPAVRGELPREVGSMFAQARRAQGLSQKELAARTGVQQAVISRLENGRGNPTVELLHDLAAGLGKRLTIGLET